MVKEGEKMKDLIESKELVKEVMSIDPVWLPPEEKVVSAINLMRSFEIGSVIVCENKKPLNIITHRDIIYVIIHKCEELTIKNFIEKCKPKKELKVILDTATVYEAMQIMEKEKVKHLPVVNRAGTLVGIITATDILKKVTHVALIDPLTKVYNRRYLDVVSFKLKGKAGFSVLMLDIDDFKKINDTYGHSFGDKVLARLGKVLLKSIRNYDDPIRYGGEEFLVIIYRAGLKEAVKVAERIRETFSQEKYKQAPELKVTLSVGVANSKSGEDLWDVIRRADQALYQAKRKGKNRVEIYKN